MKPKPIKTFEELDKALEKIKESEEKEQMNNEMNNMNEINEQDLNDIAFDEEINSDEELNDFFGDDTDNSPDTQTGEFKPDRRFCEVAESSISQFGGKASAMENIIAAGLYGERMTEEGVQLLIKAYQLGVADSLPVAMTPETVAGHIACLPDDISFRSDDAEDLVIAMIKAGQPVIAAAITKRICAVESRSLMLVADDDETQDYPIEMFAVTDRNRHSYFGEYIRTAPLRRIVRLFSRIIKIEAWDYFDIVTDFGRNDRYFKSLMYCMYVRYLRSGSSDEMTAYYRRCSLSSVLLTDDEIIESVVSLLGNSAGYARDEGSFASFVDFYHSVNNSSDTDIFSPVGNPDAFGNVCCIEDNIGFSYANAHDHVLFGISDDTDD